MTIPASEDFLLAIQSAEHDFELQIPSNVSHSFAGGEASFAQALCTWAKLQTTRKLITFAKGPEDPQIKKVAQLFYGLVAALDADSITDNQGDSVIASIRIEALKRLKALQAPNPFEQSSGNQFQILCADHLGYSHPELLYTINSDGQRRMRSRKEFQYIAKQIFRYLVQSRFEESWHREITVSLGTMLYEIFKNTEDHGMRDANRNRIMHSMRGVHARFHAVAPSNLEKIAQGYEPFQKYASGLQPDPSHKQITFMEITVFDSGLGFAPTWLKQPLDTILPSQELAAVRECFDLGKSSKQHDGYGQGLPQVIRALRQSKGFFRLRTGRLSLYSNFSLPRDSDEGLNLELWSRNGSYVLAPVAGALITLIIPLRRKGIINLGEST